jgi:GTP-binding protein
MSIGVNDSPLAGEEGKLLTSTSIKDRLYKEIETNVALRVSANGETSYKVSGRGELQLGVLIETMRREGFEMSVSSPRVVYQKAGDDKVLEPIEEVTVDVDNEYTGIVIEKLAQRKGELKEMVEYADKARLIFDIPTRGLLGYYGEFKNDTHGSGVLNHTFSRYHQIAH